MGSPFDQAWSLLKMPIYETGIPGIRFVTRGEDESDWMEQDNVYGYVPGDPRKGQGEIQHITPSEFGEMTTGNPKGAIYGYSDEQQSPREVGHTFYQDLMDRAEAGEDILFGMPYVFSDLGPQSYHEGRHRMAELFARGHGDVPLPVKVIRGTH